MQTLATTSCWSSHRNSNGGKTSLARCFSECLVLWVCEIYKVLVYECTKTNLNLWKPFCSQRSIPFLKGVGLPAMGKKCRKCRETRKELIEFLILVSHERLCLSCWSGVLHEFLLETLDWHDSLFLHWLPCIIVRTYIRTIPPDNFPRDLRFGNKCTKYPDLKFFSQERHCSPELHLQRLPLWWFGWCGHLSWPTLERMETPLSVFFL